MTSTPVPRTSKLPQALFRLSIVIITIYGLFASLYWPMTAIDPDVVEAFKRLQPANNTALIIACSVWTLVLVSVAAFNPGLHLKQGKAGPWLLLLGFGVAAASVVLPTSYASIAVYNVIPWDAPYPDQLTPIISWGGVALAVVGAIGALRAGAKHHGRSTSDGDLIDQRR